MQNCKKLLGVVHGSMDLYTH
jgi:hypothetical protein